MAAPKKNRYAAKPACDRLDAHLHILCHASDKDHWQEAADSDGITPAAWVRKILNEAAGSG